VDFQLIGLLVGLRYKLLWAKIRTRNGRIALFMAGYLLLALVGISFALLGATGGMVAVKAGKAERLVQGALTAIFVCATVTSVMLGFGLNQVFSDAELRRFPLNSRERRVARHGAGLADPFWLLFLALYLGIAFGVYLFGTGNLLLGALAALLLFACNYLAAQAIGQAIERLMEKKGGSFVLPVILMAVAFLPSLLAPMLRKNPAALRALVRVLSYTPPFGAGTMMTRANAAALGGLALIAWWGVGLVAALVGLERRPSRIRIAQTGSIRWETPFAHMAAWFGPVYAPLVEHWLLFLFRGKRFRLSYLMSLVLVPFLLLIWSGQGTHGGDPFAGAVGVFAVAGLAPAAAFIVNQFGYLGSAFRRYFLFPLDPAAALRASSYTLIGLCSVYVPLAAVAWVLFAPVSTGVRGMAMLLCSGIFGLFLFHGLGLWTTLFGPRCSDPSKTVGNDLSLLGNIVVVGGMIALLLTPRFVGEFHKGLIRPDQWPVTAVLAALAIAFYLISLRCASALLPRRREWLLAVLEKRA